jgi:hypothetical protein
MPDLTVLEDMDFEDPKNFWTMNRKEPPREFGVYVILRPGSGPPSFLENSTGGTYRQDPTTRPSSHLYRRWVDETPIMYIGAAGLRGLLKVSLTAGVDNFLRG